MRFGPWYPLADAGVHAPAAENVLQLRLADGLLDYPLGKSAMVHYEHAADVRVAAIALAARFADRISAHALVCRHLEIEPGSAVDLAAFHAKVLDDFIRRFGRAPALFT